jgi:hypothetical protein
MIYPFFALGVLDFAGLVPGATISNQITSNMGLCCWSGLAL